MQTPRSPSTPIFKRRAASIVLDALQLGLEVEMEGYTWVLVENTRGNKELCVLATSEKAGVVENVYLRPDTSFNDFFYMCSQLTDADVSVLTANITLNKMARERAAKREP